MGKITRNFLIAGAGLAATYGIMKAVANRRTEPEDIDGDNLYVDVSIEDARKVGVYEGKVKPVLDQELSFSGLVILSPLIGLISLVVYLDDPGPVLFTQKRIGKNKTYFMCHKFRSMKMSTPHDVPTHMLVEPDQYITRAGRMLRKTSMDEIPQIWDIFRSKMSVIGPRPALWNQDDLVAERDKYGANDVMPGLTGLAQISGRDELEIPDKARIDGEYVAALRLGGWRVFVLDCRILIRTVRGVLRHEGVVEGGTGSKS